MAVAVLAFSSTKPNIFDTAEIAEAKLLQIATGHEAAVTVGGTVTYTPATNGPFDTEPITLEKILQNNQ